MGKGGDWLEWGDDRDMKLPRPLVVSMFPPSFGEAQLLGLDKWYLLCVTVAYAYKHTHAQNTHTTRTHTHTHTMLYILTHTI